MSEIPSIESVMVDAPISIDLSQPVLVAQDTMIDNEVRHLPVVDAGQLVGMLTDRDVAVLEMDPDWATRSEKLLVRDVCALDVYAVEPDTPLDVVLHEMAQRRIGSAVVTHAGDIVGLFTATDACRCFADYLRRAG